MKALFEFDQATGLITGKNGSLVYCVGIEPFEQVEEKNLILDLVKQGLTADDLINLKKQDLLD